MSLALVGVIALGGLPNDAAGAAADAGVFASAGEIAESPPGVLFAAGSGGSGDLISGYQTGALLFHRVGPLLQSFRADMGQSVCHASAMLIAR